MFSSIVWISFIVFLSDSVAGAKDPFSTIEAKSFDINVGCKEYFGMGDIDPGDYLGYKELNFYRNAIAITMRISHFDKRQSGRRILLRLDSNTSAPFLTYSDFFPTLDRFQTLNVTLLIPSEQRPRGVRDLYITFEGPEKTTSVVDLFWFRFTAGDEDIPTQTPTQCPTQPPVECPTPQPTTAQCNCSSNEIPSVNTTENCNMETANESKKKYTINIVVEDV